MGVITVTRKEASRITYGYKVITGYCCYQDLNLSQMDLIRIGENCGIYGWNWSLFLDPKTGIFFCSGYRNNPKFREEVKAEDVQDLYSVSKGGIPSAVND